MKDEEMRKKVWTGVVPTWTQYGEPKAASDNLVAKVPQYVNDFVRKENEDGKRKAEEATIEPKK